MQALSTTIIAHKEQQDQQDQQALQGEITTIVFSKCINIMGLPTKEAKAFMKEFKKIDLRWFGEFIGCTRTKCLTNNVSSDNTTLGRGEVQLKILKLTDSRYPAGRDKYSYKVLKATIKTPCSLAANLILPLFGLPAMRCGWSLYNNSLVMYTVILGKRHTLSEYERLSGGAKALGSNAEFCQRMRLAIIHLIACGYRRITKASFQVIDGIPVGICGALNYTTVPIEQQPVSLSSILVNQYFGSIDMIPSTILQIIQMNGGFQEFNARLQNSIINVDGTLSVMHENAIRTLITLTSVKQCDLQRLLYNGTPTQQPSPTLETIITPTNAQVGTVHATSANSAPNNVKSGNGDNFLISNASLPTTPFIVPADSSNESKPASTPGYEIELTRNGSTVEVTILTSKGQQCHTLNLDDGESYVFKLSVEKRTPQPRTNITTPTFAPVTSAPAPIVNQEPILSTSAPVTSAPVTSAPVTSVPTSTLNQEPILSTSTPVTSAPATSTPVTSAPVTSAPAPIVNQEPILSTSAPVTQEILSIPAQEPISVTSEVSIPTSTPKHVQLPAPPKLREMKYAQWVPTGTVVPPIDMEAELEADRIEMEEEIAYYEAMVAIDPSMRVKPGLFHFERDSISLPRVESESTTSTEEDTSSSSEEEEEDEEDTSELDEEDEEEEEPRNERAPISQAETANGTEMQQSNNITPNEPLSTDTPSGQMYNIRVLGNNGLKTKFLQLATRSGNYKPFYRQMLVDKREDNEHWARVRSAPGGNAKFIFKSHIIPQGPEWQMCRSIGEYYTTINGHPPPGYVFKAGVIQEYFSNLNKESLPVNPLEVANRNPIELQYFKRPCIVVNVHGRVMVEFNRTGLFRAIYYDRNGISFTGQAITAAFMLAYPEWPTRNYILKPENVTDEDIEADPVISSFLAEDDRDEDDSEDEEEDENEEQDEGEESSDGEMEIPSATSSGNQSEEDEDDEE